MSASFSDRVRSTAAWQIFMATCSGWSSDNAPRLGASLAFYSILSLVPLLLLVLSAASVVWGREAAQGQVQGQVIAIFGSHAAEAMQNVLTSSANNPHAGIVASLTSFITLLFSASGMFGELQAAMNVIWKVKTQEGQSWLLYLKTRGFSFLMVLSCGTLLLLSVVVSAGVTATKSYIDGLVPAAHDLLPLTDVVASLSIVTLLFALIFKVVPDRAIPWKSVWLGGALTAVLFVIGKVLIGFYLGHFGIASTYGAAGSIVALLVWVYYSSQILFLGAEFTFAYSTFHKYHSDDVSVPASGHSKPQAAP